MAFSQPYIQNPLLLWSKGLRPVNPHSQNHRHFIVNLYLCWTSQHTCQTPTFRQSLVMYLTLLKLLSLCIKDYTGKCHQNVYFCKTMINLNMFRYKKWHMELHYRK